VSGLTGSVLSYSAAAANAAIATVLAQGSTSEATKVAEVMLNAGPIELAVGAVALVGGIIRITIDVLGFMARR
jgi:hypothetical protein